MIGRRSQRLPALKRNISRATLCNPADVDEFRKIFQNPVEFWNSNLVESEASFRFPVLTVNCRVLETAGKDGFVSANAMTSVA